MEEFKLGLSLKIRRFNLESMNKNPRIKRLELRSALIFKMWNYS